MAWRAGLRVPVGSRVALGAHASLPGELSGNRRLENDDPQEQNASLEVDAESDTDNRRLLGLDDAAASVLAVRLRVRIGAHAASDADLREIAAWGEAHSPVACTMRMPPAISTEVEILR